MSWANGRPTESWNLVGICDRCHTAIHQWYIAIEGIADDPLGLAFRDRFRRILPFHPTPPRGPPPPTPVEYRHPYGERLDHSEVWVNPSRTA